VIPAGSNAVSAELRPKFAAIHRQWQSPYEKKILERAFKNHMSKNKEILFLLALRHLEYRIQEAPIVKFTSTCVYLKKKSLKNLFQNQWASARTFPLQSYWALARIYQGFF
jgi:hypothetical protein